MLAKQTNTEKIVTQALPVMIFIILVVLEKFFSSLVPGLTVSEQGLVENLQALMMLFVAFYTGFVLLRGGLSCPWLKGWFVLGLVGALYVFFEEISYGQHYFGWGTPENWGIINDQNETNLHNVSSWLDQKPRLLMEIGVIVGGILMPLWEKFKPNSLPDKFRTLYPDPSLFVIALLAIIPRFYERFIDAFDFDTRYHLFYRTSEVQELYLYYFILLYFVYLYQKLKGSKL